MRLLQVDFANYRSLAHTELLECGNFNVLIGKNNSGKSNILSAIDLFFRYFRQVSGIASPWSQQHLVSDRYGRKDQQPIKLSAALLLDDDELSPVVAGIEEESPQLRHALRDAHDYHRLEIELCFTGGPDPVGYVASVALVSDSAPTSQKMLLRLDDAVANEIAAKAHEASTLRDRREALAEAGLAVGADDYMRFKDRRPGMSTSLLLRRLNIHSEVIRDVDTLIVESADYASFKANIDAMVLDHDQIITRVLQTPITGTFNIFAGETAVVPNYITDLLSALGNVKILHLGDRREPIGQREAARLLQLKMSRGGGPLLGQIQSTVNTLLGVSIDAFAGDGRIVSSRETTAELDVDDFLVQLNGSGIREALRLILDVEFAHPSILLVEEPEVHLHPSLEHAVMNYLFAISEKAQVIITTHSTNFLDSAGTQNVYLVRRMANLPDAATTQIHHLKSGEAEVEIPGELGLRLSSVFLFDTLIFVEGLSDESVYRQLCDGLELNLSRTNVGFVPMGGVRNFTHYAAGAVMDFLHKRQVKMAFILDHDEQSPDEINRLKALVGVTAEVHVLERREIENYLLDDPYAIAEYISSKRELGGLGPVSIDVPEIQAVLKDECDKLRDFTIGRRVIKQVCRPWFVSRSALSDETGQHLIDAVVSELARLRAELDKLEAGAPNLVRDATEKVGAEWEGRKLQLVPGDLLLDAVFKRYGVRFRKESDGSRLARLMDSSKIAKDLRGILESIAR